MAGAFVQQVASGTRATTGTTMNVVVTANSTAGHTLVFADANASTASSGRVTAITTPRGNTWVSLAESTAGHSNMWAAFNAAGLVSGDTLIVHYTTVPGRAVGAICEYSGLTTTPLDLVKKATAASGTTKTVKATTTVANDLIVCTFGQQRTTATPTTSPAGFTKRLQLVTTGHLLAFGDFQAGAPGTYTLTWSWTGSSTANIIAASFKPAAPAVQGSAWFPLLWERGG